LLKVLLSVLNFNPFLLNLLVDALGEALDHLDLFNALVFLGVVDRRRQY
jgi:hypothetical protein